MCKILKYKNIKYIKNVELCSCIYIHIYITHLLDRGIPVVSKKKRNADRTPHMNEKCRGNNDLNNY
jgi:hypothetical protein